MPSPSLTSRQRAFVAEYLRSNNATQAAIQAGYSAKTAHSAGPRLLQNVGVATALREVGARTEGMSQITREEIIGIWANMARAPIDVEKMSWTDKHRATDSLARTFGMYQDDRVANSGFMIQINLNGGSHDGS